MVRVEGKGRCLDSWDFYLARSKFHGTASSQIKGSVRKWNKNKQVRRDRKEVL